jgi:triacylglycerol esterase/lipase EstA (alpha/beta hydrolase family)
MIGHSMGGPTIRMFVHLMRYGNQTEVDAAIASNSVVSPLFWTNKTNSGVSSVFTIS